MRLHGFHDRLGRAPRQLTKKPTCGEYPPMSHTPRVVAVAYDGLSLFEAGIVAEVFDTPRPEFPRPLYEMRVAQAEPGELRSAGGLRFRADGGLRLLRNADLVIVPGWRNHRELPPPALARALRAAHARGCRLMSI